MACQITYNSDNKIAKVTTPTGEESRVFNQISKLPHVKNLEDALEIYKNIYTEENIVEEDLRFVSDIGNSFSSYKEALMDSLDKDIEVYSGNTLLMAVSSNLNKNTTDGLINYLIKDGILSPERIVENGESFFRAEGTDVVKQIINENIIKEHKGSVVVHHDGRVEINELEKGADTKMRQTLNDASNRIYGAKSGELSESALKNRLLEFLKSIGVTVTTIEEYSKKYAQKNGVEPTAEALADIANKVVAFREGRIDISELTEETAHFIVEGWNQTEIENLLRNIHKTDAYQKHSETYREIYRRENQSLSETELDNLVRREILGKELAEALQNRFSTQNKTESQVNILQRLYNLLLDFFNGIVLQGNYKDQLDSLTEKVEDMLLSQDIKNYVNTSQYDNRKFKMYSVRTQTPLIRGLEEQERILIKLGKGSSDQLRELQSYMMGTIEKSNVQNMINLARRQTRYIKGAIEEANRRGVTLSNEEGIVFQNLRTVISPGLAQLKISIEKDSNYRFEVADIEAVQNEILDSVGLMQQSENDILDSVVDRLMKRHNWDESVREELKANIATVKKDTNALYSYFGQITHAQDPLLNILGSIISDLHQDSSEEFVESSKEFQRKIRELGYKEEDVSKFLQKDGYIVSKWDFAAFEEFRRYAKAEVYRANIDEIIASAQDPAEIAEHEAFKKMGEKEFLENFKDIPFIANVNMRNKIVALAQTKVNEGSETYLSEDYIKKQDDKIKDFSEATKIKLRSLSQQKAQVKRQTKKSKSGVTIFTLQNKIDLDAIASERAKYTSIYNLETGDLKDGIVPHSTEVEGSVKISEGTYITLNNSPSEEAVIAFEMNKLKQSFIEEIRAKGGFAEGLSDAFRKDLAEMESDPEVKREDIISWFNLNSTVGFSNAFFANRDDENLFEKYSNDPAVADKIETYKKLLQRRRNVISQYKDSRNAVNITAETMPESVKKSVLSLSEDIDRISSEVFMYLRGKGEEMSRDERARTGANESYFNALKDYNKTTVEEQLEFTLEHMTASKRSKVTEPLDAVKNGQRPEKLEYIFEEYGYSKEGVLAYAQSKMLPYYASYAPIALQEFYDKVRNTNTPLSELLKDLESSDDVRISVSYEYMDDSNNDDILNPHRDLDFRGGYAQPSLRKQPTAFGKTFDFNNKQWDSVKNDKELYDLVINHQIESYKNMDYEHGNIYVAPQVQKTKTEKIFSAFKGQAKETFNEALKGLANYRISDIAEGELDEKGQALYLSNIKVIPRYYVNKLEDSSNVSTDLFFSMMMLSQQASLRKNRVKYYSEVSSVLDAIGSGARYNGIGKQAEATNTYKMAKSFIDNALYGVEDVARAKVSIPIVGQMDLTKILKSVHRWKQNLSLAYNPIVPLTSYLTAASGLVGERMIGQYVDADSMDKARRAFVKNGWKDGADALAPYSGNEALTILERLGLNDLSNRFRNSKYNQFSRLLGKAGYGMHQMGDYPVKSNVAYAMLYGHRVADGKLMDFNTFSKARNGAGKTKSEIKSEWKDLKSLYEYTNIENGKFDYNDNLYTDLNVSKEEFKNLEKGVISKAKTLAQRVDGTIRDEERTFAQRHFALRYTMTHRGWLALAAANRFKGKHLNTQTGLWEEGTYVTLGNVISRMLNNSYGALKSGDMSKVAETWKNLSQEEKVNLQRVLKEMAVLGGIYALGLIFAGFADDDEESLYKQFLAYLFERTTNESISSQLGVVKELYSSAKEPVVGIQQMLELPQIYKVATGDELVERGRYAGMSERKRWLIKNVVGVKPIYDLWDAENLKAQRDAYNFFSNGSDDWNPFAYIITKEEYLEE